MKPPPLLLGATLLFWGWQSNLFLPGALLAVIIEGAQVFKVRWDFSDDDFSRVWTLCALLLLGAALYAFSSNEGPASVSFLLGEAINGNPQAATVASARTATMVLRWLPMIFFPFLLAQAFSTRESVPLVVISLILQRRWKKAKLRGQPAPSGPGFNIGYPYFCATLLAASFHPAEDNSYFWGFCGLLTWALWTHRSRRFGLAVWLGLLVLVGAGGYFGQRGLSQLQQYITNLNPQWLARFMRRSDDAVQSRTALGSIGNIKLSSRIVVRLEPPEAGPVPPYLREASYRIFNGRSWHAGSSRDDFQQVYEDSPTVTPGQWTLLPEFRTNTVRIACYLEGYDNNTPAGLLPLPTGTTRLEGLFAYQLDRNSAGAVMAHGPGLVMFDARYGGGETIDAVPGWGTAQNFGTQRMLAEESGRWFGRRGRGGRGLQGNRPPQVGADLPPVQISSNVPPPLITTNEDLFVPVSERAALEVITNELQLAGRPLREVLAGVAQFFDQQFAYRLWQPVPLAVSVNDTPTSRFLLETRAGHCEYFASATVLLLRQLGIPARYATGYAVHEKSGSGYVVRLSDAHAWTLVWDEARKIWFDFDTTPGAWVATERNKFAPLVWLTDAWNRLVFEFSKFRNGQSRLQQYLVWVVVPGMALLLYQVIFRRGRKRSGSRSGEAEFTRWPGLDSDFYRLERRLTERGLARGAAEPLHHWLRRVLEHPQLAALRPSLEEILRLHYRYRFDPLGLNAVDRETLQRETNRCLEQIAQPAAE